MIAKYRRSGLRLVWPMLPVSLNCPYFFNHHLPIEFQLSFFPFNILCIPLNCLALMSESMLIIPIPPSSTRKQHTSLFPTLNHSYPFPLFSPFPFPTLNLPPFLLLALNPSSYPPLTHPFSPALACLFPSLLFPSLPLYSLDNT